MTINNKKLRPEAKIAWGLTGAGHFLPECVEILTALEAVDIFLSQAAKEVINSYRLEDRIKESNHLIYLDNRASSPAVTGLYTGKYKLAVIAPATSNTIAKMVHGIADNLITNLFAHAGKCRVPTIVLPCDMGAHLKSQTPKGQEVAVYVRRIDEQNIRCLASWEGITLVNDPQDLNTKIDSLINDRN